jgi:hypothetical protein
VVVREKAAAPPISVEHQWECSATRVRGQEYAADGASLKFPVCRLQSAVADGDSGLRICVNLHIVVGGYPRHSFPMEWMNQGLPPG